MQHPRDAKTMKDWQILSNDAYKNLNGRETLDLNLGCAEWGLVLEIEKQLRDSGIIVVPIYKPQVNVFKEMFVQNIEAKLGDWGNRNLMKAEISVRISKAKGAGGYASEWKTRVIEITVSILDSFDGTSIEGVRLVFGKLEEIAKSVVTTVCQTVPELIVGQLA